MAVFGGGFFFWLRGRERSRGSKKEKTKRDEKGKAWVWRGGVYGLIFGGGQGKGEGWMYEVNVGGFFWK